jgi:cytochrome P450
VTLLKEIHRDPRHFKEPLAFNPDRFIDSDGNLMKNPKIMPFQAGMFTIVVSSILLSCS